MSDDIWSHAGEPVTIAPAAILKSPAFQAPYPKIVNADIIPSDMKGTLEQHWCRGRFEERDIGVFRLKGGFVTDENLIFDDELRVMDNLDDGYSSVEITRAVETIRERRKIGRLPYLDGVGIVIKRRAAGNYGHYLLYMVPLALLGRRLFGDRNPRYLAHYTLPPMNDVVLRSLRLMGISLDRVLMLNYGEPVHFEEIVYFTGLAEHGSYLSPVAVQTVVEMASPIPAGAHRKLFVRRIPGWQRGRLLRNEVEIAQRLAARGFHVIEPGSLSLEEQISLFKGAEHVVGAVGASMTNVVFCQPGTNVSFLWPGGFPDTFFWFIATHRQLNYLDIRGDPFPIEGKEAWLADFSIREADIQRLEVSSLTTASDRRDGDMMKGMKVLAELHHGGTVERPLGEWVPERNSTAWIEAFAITVPDGMPSNEIEYQAIMDVEQLSPWVTGGMYAGYRGMSRPIRGLAVRLRGQLAAQYECFCSAIFSDFSVLDHVPSSQYCEAGSHAPLMAFQVTLKRR
ncbi:MAG: glycosyltransferase family 61 protein [Acetobacteraceae bacterium]